MTEISKKLNQAKVNLMLNKSLVLYKDCKSEMIEYEFTTNQSSTFCDCKIKRYYQHDTGKCKKLKHTNMFKPINSLIDDDIYELFMKGYKIK